MEASLTIEEQLTYTFSTIFWKFLCWFDNQPLRQRLEHYLRRKQNFRNEIIDATFGHKKALQDEVLFYVFRGQNDNLNSAFKPISSLLICSSGSYFSLLIRALISFPIFALKQDATDNISKKARYEPEWVPIWRNEENKRYHKRMMPFYIIARLNCF